MDESVPLTDNRTSPMTTSWLVSCLLHGGLAVSAIFFVQRMQLAPRTEPFQWNVAMVATASPSMEPTSRAASVVHPTSTLRQPVQSATHSRSVVRTVQPRLHSPVTPPPPEPISEFTPEPQQPQSDLPPQTSSQHLSNPSATDEPVSPTHDRSPSLLESQITTDSTLSSPASANASTASIDQLQPAKADYGDYGWLTDLMTRWIEDLNKRYPAMLRTEGIQGKVMLTAMLHDDGLLSDVRVIKSSGNTTLDEVAVEDVRNGPPINLSRPLERAKMPVKFSISYDLKEAQ